MALPRLQRTDALIVVDVQNDFCPGGALPIEQGDRVVPVLNRWIEAARNGGARIVVTRDWHPADHISFRERGGPWPAHCVQNTWGAEMRPDLKLPEDVLLLSKGTTPDRDDYSDFEMTGLAEELKKNGIRRVWVGGLAQDMCVRATVLDGLRKGFEVHLILNATRPVNALPGAGDRAHEEMRAAGCVIEAEQNHA
ncbi:MAG: nicotinamidase [Deltaproteobacteria bacterium]